MNNVSVLIFIFLLKSVGGMITTLRQVLTNKGMKKISMIISLFEGLLWIITTITVIDNIMENPLKILAYVLGNTFGIYLGMWLESKLALGNMKVHCIVSDENHENVVSLLKQEGFGVTGVKLDIGSGCLLLTYIPRKELNRVYSEIRKIQEDAVLTAYTMYNPKNTYGF